MLEKIYTVIQSNYKPNTTKFHYTMSLSVPSIYLLNTSQIFHRIFWVGQELSEEKISQELWRNSVLPFCYHPSRLHSVTHIEIIWFALLHVRYLNKDGKYDIRSMGDLLHSETGQTSLGISKGSRWFLVCQHQCFSLEHKCVNEVNCQVIPTPWVSVVELSRS